MIRKLNFITFTRKILYKIYLLCNKKGKKKQRIKRLHENIVFTELRILLRVIKSYNTFNNYQVK